MSEWLYIVAFTCSVVVVVVCNKKIYILYIYMYWPWVIGEFVFFFFCMSMNGSSPQAFSQGDTCGFAGIPPR